MSALPAVAQAPAASVPPAQSHATMSDAYRLGSGDRVQVDIYGEPTVSGQYQVSGAGTVTMPLIGDVPATGSTARELEATLRGRYGAGYLRDPKISVQVLNFRPYYILGEVQKPGSYPSTEGATLLSAIATAGGFTYRANTKRGFLRREGQKTEQRVELGKDLHLEPGDVLRIGERYF